MKDNVLFLRFTKSEKFIIKKRKTRISSIHGRTKISEFKHRMKIIYLFDVSAKIYYEEIYISSRAVSRLDFHEIRESRFNRDSIFPRIENLTENQFSREPRSRKGPENREFFIYLFQAVKFYVFDDE